MSITTKLMSFKLFSGVKFLAQSTKKTNFYINMTKHTFSYIDYNAF